MEIWLGALGALLIAAIVIDVKARRRHRRLRVSQDDVRRAKWDNQGRYGGSTPGGIPPGGGGL